MHIDEAHNINQKIFLNTIPRGAPRNPYLYIIHNGLHIRLSGDLNVFVTLIIIHPSFIYNFSLSVPPPYTHDVRWDKEMRKLYILVSSNIYV
jgi:hypothetical protein